MVAMKQKDGYWEPELCTACHSNLPPCTSCGKPKGPDSLRDGRCWACNRQRDEELDPAQLCKDCGKPFITFKHANWFTSKDLKIPRSHETIKQHCPPKVQERERQRPTEGRQQSLATPAAVPQARGARPTTTRARSLWTRIRDRLNL
jgi:hypothetical protein